jgi:predicted nucleic acid-binding protein
MTAVLVDSNILLDVMTEDERWSAWSSEALAQAADRYRLVINPIIYAEVSVRYSRIEDVEDALPKATFEREAIPFEAAFLAGKAFLSYRRRGEARHAPLPDFFIGAHAAVAGYRLITRDAKRFQSCFPHLSLICPKSDLPVN